MVRLPLKEDIRNNPVPVPVKGGRILPVGVYEDLPLQNRGLLCVRSHIVQFLPAVHVLRDRLPVEKDNGNIRLHSLIDHAGRGGTVHHIDAEHVAAKIDHTLRLAVLRELKAGKWPENAKKVGDYFAAELAKMPHVVTVRHRGLFVGVVLEDGINAVEVKRHCIKNHFLVTAIGANIIRMVPPLTIREVDCDEAVVRLSKSINEVAEGK